MDQWCTNPASNQGLDIDLQAEFESSYPGLKGFFFSLLKRGILRIKTFSVCLKRKQKENL